MYPLYSLRTTSSNNPIRGIIRLVITFTVVLLIFLLVLVVNKYQRKRIIKLSSSSISLKGTAYYNATTKIALNSITDDTKVEQSTTTLNRRQNNDGKSYYYYTIGRMDRSGAILQDILAAHAYCYAKNYTYFGVCYIPTSTKEEAVEIMNNTSRLYHQQIISDLNLQSIVQFFHPCPTNNITSSKVDPAIANITTTTTMKLLNPKLYNTRNMSKYWTRDWMQYIHNKIEDGKNEQEQENHEDQGNYSKNLPEAVTTSNLVSNSNYQSSNIDETTKTANTTVINIYIHIRRGDVTLCNPKTSFRYTPNQYYLDLLQQIIVDEDGRSAAESSSDEQNNSEDDSAASTISLPSFVAQQVQRSSSPYILYNITIYSERTSLESWDEFGKQLQQQFSSTINYTYHLLLESKIDTPEAISSIWMDIVNHASIFIMSKSSFSIIPALLMSVSNTTNTSPKVVIAPLSFWYDALPHWVVPFANSDSRKQRDYEKNLRFIARELESTLCR